MDSSYGGEGPAVLQLHSWDSSKLQLNLAEFHEAFLSPSRQLLLLLSHQNEALLLPLLKGNSVDSTDPECCNGETLGDPSSLYSEDVHRSDVRDNCASTSGLEKEFDSGFLSDNSISEVKTFICDVNSVAWGACGDTYGFNLDPPFKEFLFLSGSHGLIVHAFCCHDLASKGTPETHLGEGRWMDWGPDTATCQSSPSKETPGSFHEASENILHENRIIKDEESDSLMIKGSGKDEQATGFMSKRWLRSFFTEAEMVNSDGSMGIKFPPRSSYPSSAKVVSFSIFGTCFHSSNSCPEADQPRVDLDPADNTDISSTLQSFSSSFQSEALSTLLGVGPDCCYSCIRVFSSNSHSLIGFVLMLKDFFSPEIYNRSESCRSTTFVVVARLHSWGIKWVSSVNLSKHQMMVPIVGWTDFCFSSDLLACLTASGLISFYSVMSGEYVRDLDIMQICQVNPLLRKPDPEREHVANGIQTQENGEASEESETNCSQLYDGRKFKRLVGSSHTSLIAAVDKMGITYVICAADYLPDKYYSNLKLLPHFQHLELGTLVGWEVGDVSIGHSLAYSNVSEFVCEENERASLDDNGRNVLENTQKKRKLNSIYSSFSEFSASKMACSRFKSLDFESNRRRTVFLPKHGFNKDDCICLSPLGITRLIRKKNGDKYGYQIVHHGMYAGPRFHDDWCLKSGMEVFNFKGAKECLAGEVLGCSFQSCMYLVTHHGLSVVLPRISVSPKVFSSISVGCRQKNNSKGTSHEVGNHSKLQMSTCLWSPWKVELLDRVILYEGPQAADHLCSMNGWDLKLSRIRRLQLALDFLKFDEIEKSLEMLVAVDLAEEGVLRILFSVAYLLFGKGGSDNEVAAASRLLALASSFATKIIRMYGLSWRKKDGCETQCRQDQACSVSTILPEEVHDERRKKILYEMAYNLEAIRNLQFHIVTKFQKPGQGLVVVEEPPGVANTSVLRDDSESTSIVLVNAPSHKKSNSYDYSLSVSALGSSDMENRALTPLDSLDSGAHLDSEDLIESSALVPKEVQGEVSMGLRKNVLPLENPQEMVARWKVDNLDLRAVVKDALLSGRLPLAVLQLHLHHSRHLMNENEQPDTFSEVCDIGRAIAYDLFLKGETKLAVATLERLGEDIKIILKQLLFGTVRRSLRLQILEEMDRCSYLGAHDWKLLERITLIERLYPSSSFWKTYLGRLENFKGITLSDNKENCLQLPLSSASASSKIGCGEIDGVILGSWLNVTGNSSVMDANEDSADIGYWAAAAVWSSLWDKKIIDRIVLDQPLLMGVHVLWESQLEYYISHNDWEEVAKLLDLIPASMLSNGRIQINLDNLPPHTMVGHQRQVSFSDHFSSSFDELDAVCMDVPDVKLFNFSADLMCSMWLRMHIESLLAKQLIFTREYWESTCEILPILARSGFIKKENRISSGDGMPESSSDVDASSSNRSSPAKSVNGLYKVIVHHCVEYNLPNLLDIYLDHHELVFDKDSLVSFQEAVGDCQWAKWLLFSRVKGCEYEASFCNSHAITTPRLVPGNSLGVAGTDEIIHTVDDIAEGGEELAALATLMFARVPVQNCLSTGSVKRQSTSAQCTLENLKPILLHYPSLGHTFAAACLGQDMNFSFYGNKVKNVLHTSVLSDYLNWRENVFFSAGRDTSLVQMLPCWFPKSVRRLIQLYVQGPVGWQSLTVHGDIDLFMNCDEVHNLSEISWEALIQKHIEDELYDSSLKETGSSVEHYLHRGRALAAFNYLLGMRVQKLKLEQSAASVHGQANVQSDIQTLLAPVIQSEEALLSSVMPLAILHFEDSVLVASCTFLLELCGLSASMLHVDVAALKRISSFYKSNENCEGCRQQSPKASAFHARLQDDVTESLARALADEYLHKDHASITKHKETSDLVASRRHSRALSLVLQHLEKASLPLMVDGKTCGCWLLNGIGDGMELRSQQKASSQQWSLVIAFCLLHQLPLSTKYLAVLARDNDWVGFLSEAHIGGYPFDIVMQVASKEFGDPRLRLHILTVLKNMQLRKKSGSSSYVDHVDKSNVTSFSDDNIYVPMELFGILAECEKQKNPGEALLVKAKQLSWSILAMIASCFSDVTPLACLTVWLEITAARETSSIKVNDIASQIANNVSAAVEASNILPAGDRAPSFHYNRRNPKRRRFMEPITNRLVAQAGEASNSPRARMSIIHRTEVEEESQMEFSTHEVSSESDEGPDLLSKMVAVLCEQQLFLPLLRAFDLFLPSCSLLPFIRALQAFSQMRLSEATAHLGSFSVRIKEEPTHLQTSIGKEEHIASSWISSTAVKAADAVISTCPSPYEKRCLLQLLAATDFGDGGYAATHYCRLYWKINLAEPSLRVDDSLHLGNETLDDASLLAALEKNGHWEQARKWARQLEASGGAWKSAVHHVTETQAESMVAEWKEFLWDVPEERIALWGHCQTLFIRYSFPPLKAGLFFLRHAEALEKDLPARELHELLLLSLQWLSGMITLSYPVYSLNLLREIETRVWLLAVESEAQMKSEGDFSLFSSNQDSWNGCSSGIIDRTASLISKMDNHINMMRNRTIEKQDLRDNNPIHMKNQGSDAILLTSAGASTKTKRRGKGSTAVRRAALDTDKSTDPEDSLSNLNARVDVLSQDDNLKIEQSFSKWEERVGPAELERAVLSLLEFGQINAAKQLQYKLSPDHIPSEFSLVNAALKLAKFSTPCSNISILMLDEELRSLIYSSNIASDQDLIDPVQVLDHLTTIFVEGSGRGLCKRIIAVVKTANVLGISFSEAFGKQPIELLQLLSLKAQESFEEAKLLVQTNSMPAASIAHILAESFLKGLLAAHRGGYMDSQKEEGPAPLLWRFSDFLKWAELCPSEPEIGHSLMRLVITGQEIPHACEVELLILSHHFYKSSACLDGVDVLVALATNRVDSYVSEGDFQCLARLITGVGNFHALNFILGILIENGQLDLLLQKFSAAADANTCTGEAVRGFRMAVLTSLKQFNPNDLDAFAMVYNHFEMRHETAALLESRAEQSLQLWFHRYDKDQNEDLLESMRYFIEAAKVHSSIDAGNKTRYTCAQASLVSLQIRMPDFQWLNRSETNARRALVEQFRFQEALIVAEAYCLNQPSEWVLVLWNQMLQPELIEEFVAEFVAVLPLRPSMLLELARFYRAEMVARGDQSQFSVWLTGAGFPAEWAKYLARSFRCLLKRTRDLRLRMQMASLATGFEDVIGVCVKVLDKVPENAGPLVLRRGHGGAYLPLM